MRDDTTTILLGRTAQHYQGIGVLDISQLVDRSSRNPLLGLCELCFGYTRADFRNKSISVVAMEQTRLLTILGILQLVYLQNTSGTCNVDGFPYGQDRFHFVLDTGDQGKSRKGRHGGVWRERWLCSRDWRPSELIIYILDEYSASSDVVTI